MSSSTIRRSTVGSLVIVALAVTAWSAVAQAGPTPTPSATPSASPTATPTATPAATPTPPLMQGLNAPKFVRANSDGTFRYDAIFVAGPEGDQFSNYSIFCLENTVNCTEFADACFVNSELGILAPGQQLVIPVSSRLIDPAAEGRAMVELSTVCPLGSGMFFLRETTILPGPSSPTPTPTATPTPTPTATPTASPTGTPSPTPGANACKCQVANIFPGGTVANLKFGTKPTQTAVLGAEFAAVDNQGSNSCPDTPGAEFATADVHFNIVDENSQTLLDVDKTITCISGVDNPKKFVLVFDASSCGPGGDQVGVFDITTTVTGDAGFNQRVQRIRCRE